jgi:imidazolonepropionase-like amidohydrolase
MIRLTIALLVFASHVAAQTALVKAGRLLDTAAGSYRTNQGILIDSGIIQKVGPYDEVRAVAPQTATPIDLSGVTVLPGLIDCHAHLLTALPDKMNGADGLILTIAKLTPAKRALLGAQMAKEDLESGFTIVRNVGHSGIDGDVALRDAINNRWVPGPRILASARKIAPHGGQALPVQSAVLETLLNQEYLTAINPDEGRRAVLENMRVGVDWIKVVVDEWRTLNLDTLKAIVDEAHRSGLKVAAHATSKLGIQAAIDSGVDSIEHGDDATERQFQEMRAKGIYFVPTLWPADLAVRWPGLVAVDAPRRLINMDAEADRKQYKAEQQAKVDVARKVGVKIVFGSDELYERIGKTRGQATLHLLAALETFGIPPAEALRSATLDAAELLGIKTVAGSIEPKKFGDLVAVDGDPLEHLAALEKVKFVMKGGRVVRDDIHRSGS